MITPSRPPATSPARDWLGVFVLLMLLQSPLIFNPGYFSHDELQWWARADVSGWMNLPWMSWTDIAVFQYRPLTFNVWLLLAYACASTPYLMHLVVVAIGSANAVLLGACVEGAGATRRTAIAAAVAFVLTPYVAYTHGWTATLADLLTVGAALSGLRLLQRISGATARFDAPRGALVVALTGIALLSKESAIVLPAFLLLGLPGHPRRGSVLVVIALSSALVALYLGLRLPVILDTPRDAGTYAWSIGHIPQRLLEYLLFPFMPPLFEVGPTLHKGLGRLLAAAGCVVALLTALASAGWRWPLVWILQFAALLAPVLVLGTSYGQYAYLASTAAVGIVAVAWRRLRSPSKLVVGLAAAIAAVHAGAIMGRMRDVGVAQHAFYADLVERLAATPGSVAIASADPADQWMVERFLSGVATYRGVTIGRRIDQEHGAGAVQLIMRGDGHLIVANTAAPPRTPI